MLAYIKQKGLNFLAASGVFFIATLTDVPFAAAANRVQIKGWPHVVDTQKGPQESWSQDAVLGSLVCPSLTRLNLLKKASGPQLLKGVKEKKADGAFFWQFSLKDDVRYWGGSRVEVKDYVAFIEGVLGSFKGLAPFKVTGKKGEVSIRFAKEPSVGPYLFNSRPFFRRISPGKKGGLLFECAGSYAIESHSPLVLAAVSKAKKPEKIVFSDGTSGQKAEVLEFRFPEYYQNSIKGRSPLSAIKCQRKVDFPIFSAIEWNLQSPLSSQEIFRKAITHILPRGTFLRSGAGYLGDLVSAPLLRAHPGYDRGVYVRKFNVDTGKQLLRQLGFKKSEKNGFFVGQDGKNLTLKLHKPKEMQGPMEKVLKDSLEIAGIQVVFTENSKVKTDGTLTGLVSPWPEGSLSLLLKGSPVVKEKGLNALLSAYDKSLTRQKPDFNGLKKIHRVVYDLEPYSIFMQHRACLVSQSGRKIPKIIIRDPDWFWDLVKN